MVRVFHLLIGLLWLPAAVGAEHWSFRPINRPKAPSVGGNKIDSFLNARLAKAGVQANGKASPKDLIRRVSIVLTGLPPTPEQVQAFEARYAKDAEQAYIRLVEEQLSSKHFGERWAQHWLDVIRWAETVGFETNIERPAAWHYRDWVIAAFNRDLPYDRFIHDQLAGDITGADAALGFLVAGPALQPGQIGRDEEAMRSARQDELDEGHIARAYQRAPRPHSPGGAAHVTPKERSKAKQ